MKSNYTKWKSAINIRESNRKRQDSARLKDLKITFERSDSKNAEWYTGFRQISFNLHKHPRRWFICSRTRPTINGVQIEFVDSVKENRHAFTRGEFDYQQGLARHEIDISGRAYFHRLLYLPHAAH